MRKKKNRGENFSALEELLQNAKKLGREREGEGALKLQALWASRLQVLAPE